MKKNTLGRLDYSNEKEFDSRKKLLNLLKNTKIPDDELLENLGLFFNSKNLSRILALNDIYKKQIEVHGSILDLGTRWGQNANIFTSLRGIYEPFNRHKKIYAFDTFKGFNKINILDGKSVLMKKGNLKTVKNYEKDLDFRLKLNEADNPLNHIKKYEVIKGDAIVKLKNLIKKNKHIIISLVYFDFDLFEPTLECLKIIKNRLVKGSIIAFDELNDHDSPGETLAVMKEIGLNNIKLKRHKYASRVSYFVFE
tara:strand:- start:42724 stop:43482 length:759 start_codon:yes stop_codon:yes gene_type:complete